MLHNISVIFRLIFTYINNCQNTSAYLFTIGGRDISSKEGTTQEDVAVMTVMH